MWKEAHKNGQVLIAASPPPSSYSLYSYDTQSNYTQWTERLIKLDVWTNIRTL